MNGEISSSFYFHATPSLRWHNGNMRDRLSQERRSWNMSRIRGKNTTPEMVVRSLLHRMGFRFRLHVRIPIPPSTFFVRPDIVLPKYKTVIPISTTNCRE